MRRTRGFRLAFLLSAALLAGALALIDFGISAQEGDKAAPAAGAGNSWEMTPQMRERIEKGLKWLADNQNRSGGYGTGGAPVATTGVAGLALLAGGHLPGRTKYGKNVLEAVRFLVKNAGKSGYINEGQARGIGGSGMHGHGYATMFLAEVYGMTGGMEEFSTDDLKEKITMACRVIEQAQCANGGWNYEPNPSYDEGSVTVTQIQALRAARDAGIKVDQKTIEKAIDYINKSTDPSGQTRYSLTSGGHTSFALTAAGMSVMDFLGQYNNEKVKKGVDWISKQLPGKGGNNANMGAWGGWYFYGNYYASIAMYNIGGNYWKTWFTAIREDLLKTQASDGSWKNAESASYGPAFGTGFALQILEIPNRYLPIYQRGSD